MRRLEQSLIALALAVSACAEEGPTDILPGPPPPEIPPPTSPENLALAIEVIFNDKVRDASERRRAYENLFGPDFHCVDWDSCRVFPCRFFTIDGAGELFETQDSGEIYSLRLDLSFKPAADLDPPQPGREEWKMVFVSNVDFQLLVTPQDGWRVTGGQAEILAYPSADRRRWFIGEWFSRPKP